MEMKFTPGPWFVAPLEGKYYGTWVAIGPDQGVTVWTPDHYAEPFASSREIEAGWMPEDGHDHVEDARSYANARLIAAAPELLEALTECADRLQVHMQHSEDLVAHMRAHAAIAKATGA